VFLLRLHFRTSRFDPLINSHFTINKAFLLFRIFCFHTVAYAIGAVHSFLVWGELTTLNTTDIKQNHCNYTLTETSDANIDQAWCTNAKAQEQLKTRQWHSVMKSILSSWNRKTCKNTPLFPFFWKQTIHRYYFRKKARRWREGGKVLK
jgi:hypothetical protein